MTTWSNPMLGNVDGTGQKYGDSRDGGTRRHVGYDIGTGGVAGRAVVAGGDGTVLETRTTSPDARGQYVMLDHGGGIRTLYQHLAAVSVATGATVRAGQQIGVCGSTGGNYAIHLHLEDYTGGLGKQKTDHVDPKPFFAARGVVLGKSSPVDPTTPVTPPTPTQEDDMAIIYEVTGHGLVLDTLSGEIAGIGDIATANALVAAGAAKRVKISVADYNRIRAARTGRELIRETSRGYAVGTPGSRYRPLGDLAEVQYHQLKGCAERAVSVQTFDNLTKA